VTPPAYPPPSPRGTRGEGAASHAEGRGERVGAGGGGRAILARRDCSGGCPPHAPRGLGDRGRGVPGGPRRRTRRQRPPPGRPQRQEPHPKGDARSRDDRGERPSRERPAHRLRRGTTPIHEPYSAAVHAPLPEGRRGVARALPAGSVYRRLPRGARGAPREGRGRALGHEHCAPDRRVGDRVPRFPKAEPGRPRLRLRVGRWRALQRPAAGRSPLHARHDRCAARRDEGADYGRGRLPGERRELEDRAPRLEAPRQGPVYSASVGSTSTPGRHGTSFKLTSSTPGSEQVVIMGRPLLRKTLIIGRFSASTKA
jgi:hypothetical protein